MLCFDNVYFDDQGISFFSSFKKFPETLGYTGREKTIDENYPNKEIEWVTDDRYAVVPYGLLIGFF